MQMGGDSIRKLELIMTQINNRNNQKANMILMPSIFLFRKGYAVTPKLRPIAYLVINLIVMFYIMKEFFYKILLNVSSLQNDKLAGSRLSTEVNKKTG